MRSTLTTAPPSEGSLYSRQHPSAGPSRFTVADCSKGMSLFTNQPNTLRSDFSGCLPVPSPPPPLFPPFASTVAPTDDSMSSSFRSLATSASVSASASEASSSALLDSPYTSTASLDAKTTPETPKSKVTATARVIDTDPTASADARREQNQRHQPEWMQKKQKKEQDDEAELVDIPLLDDSDAAKNGGNGDEDDEDADGNEAGWVQVKEAAKPTVPKKTLAELGWVKIPKHA